MWDLFGFKKRRDERSRARIEQKKARLWKMSPEERRQHMEGLDLRVILASSAFFRNQELVDDLRATHEVLIEEAKDADPDLH